MNKIKLLLILFLLLIPNTTLAKEINLICPQITSPGKTITCTIRTDQELRGIKLKYSLSSNITYSKLSISKNWNNYYNKEDGLIITTNNPSQNLNASLELKISKHTQISTSHNISLTDIELSTTNHELLKINDLTTSIKIVSDDNTLSSLSITSINLNPKFDQNKINYVATTSQEKVIIKASPTNKNAKLSGDLGEKRLNYGTNKFKIVVTSELGTSKIYTITIIRPLPTTDKEKEKNTNSLTTDFELKTLKINDYQINFKPNIYIYDLTLPYENEILNITAIPTNPKTTISINKPDTLAIGLNTVIITLTSEDQTSCNYTINITRQEKKLSINNNKESLSTNSQPLINNLTISIVISITIFTLLILTIIKKKIKKKNITK